MGVHNVPGRQSKCGATPVMYTYPAWTFGGKRKVDDATPGPGPGPYAPPLTFGPTGPGFGHAHSPSRQPPHGHTEQVTLPPAGVVSTEAKGPAWSFGERHPVKANANPSPLSYQLPRGIGSNMTSSFGPPPRQRPVSAPRPLRPEEVVVRPAKGPSFGLARRAPHDPGVPGPAAYRPCSGDNCCRACEGYNGKSFGLRPTSMYGKVVDRTPGPAAYHTECSTLGAATQNCATGSSTFRRADIQRGTNTRECVGCLELPPRARHPDARIKASK